MPTYKITCTIKKEIEAIDEHEAMARFYEELAEENDCLDNNMEIKQLTK